jgi:spore maturation protein CgeB
VLPLREFAMKIVYFTHSLISCWNHGNAHFLRGVMRALLADGHDVRIFEPVQSWSRENLIVEGGTAAVEDFAIRFPTLAPRVAQMRDEKADLDAALDAADLVLVHEWNEPALVAAIGARRAHGAAFMLLFHDTHHRMVSDPRAMARYDLSGYDGVLAFGETLSEAYRRGGWGNRVFTWHEGADLALFHPPKAPVERRGAVWIGNWGDGERSAELRDYMLEPVATLGMPLDIYGVRYPQDVRAELARRGIDYQGWAANAHVPEIFARHLFTLHVPRRFYVTHLPGIPTIRVFEALASGIPLLSAPWQDAERLFSPGLDFLQAQNPEEMRMLMRDLANDQALRASLAKQGRQTIEARHSCIHRARELLRIVATLHGSMFRGVA